MRFLMHHPKFRAPPVRFSRSPLALLAWTLLQATSLGAQTIAPAPVASDETALPLKSSPLLQEKIPDASRSALPTFVFGERLSGRPDLETVVEGHAELRRGDLVIKADRLEYDQPDDLAKARGQVRINRAGNVYEGPLLEIGRAHV